MNTVDSSARLEANSALRCAMRLRLDEPSVYASFLGSIPSEETDEEFAAAVEALS